MLVGLVEACRLQKTTFHQMRFFERGEVMLFSEAQLEFHLTALSYGLEFRLSTLYMLPL